MNFQPNFQKGGGGVLAKISIFRGQVVEKEWMTFSGGNRGRGRVSNFYIKIN